ncbi:hypothetical protein ADK93_16935 [Streptomyces sp. XY58]|nr:hypothetical protein VR43_01595 [Streptomyces sp. NRRL S-104]KOU87255.1 hypothetical protein ADK93_16935 [Streptomyces sp. XY58]KOV07844.1 hypothetical protein ADK89_09290 [Streptomyces sp. XY37]KOV48171.1 hypothetical protein ADK99_16770 [Streptomyces sp. MMG1064]
MGGGRGFVGLRLVVLVRVVLLLRFVLVVRRGVWRRQLTRGSRRRPDVGVRRSVSRRAPRALSMHLDARDATC